MVKPQVCCNEAEIRQVIKDHLRELVQGRQEVKIAWEDELPATCIIVGYEPPKPKGKYAATLFVRRRDDENAVVITTTSELAHFEVLPTQRLTPSMAYQQMEEMEHAGARKE